MMFRIWYLQVPSCSIWKNHGIQGKKEGIDYKEIFAPMTSQVYVEQPLGVETHDRKTCVCKLKNALHKFIRHPWDRIYSYIRSLKIT